ncbi:MAG: HAD-IA family hydrolase [Planctomycetota bacterium]|nr:HAD-IA family hydrolase [Planctomycetota bacterium]
MDWAAITFDCFGTLVDWRRGTRGALSALPALSPWQDRLSEVIAARERAEQSIQRGPFLPYREVLAASLEEGCRALGFAVPRTEAEAFADSQADWPVFADTPDALRRLARLAPLGLLSNCDAAPLRACAERSLRAPIALFVDAARAGSYKPALGHWQVALEALQLPPERVLHVSAYGFYDLEPAHALGFGLAFIARDGEQAPQGLPLAHRAMNLTELADQLGV